MTPPAADTIDSKASRPANALRISGIVLAAGSSERMGTPKQLLALGDRCLLQHVVDAALSSQLDEIVVVLGHRADEVRAALAPRPEARLRIAVNSRWAEGQSSSLRCGLEAADERCVAAAVLLGDQPGVRPAVIDQMIDVFRDSAAAAVRPVYPAVAGAPGHPVLLARRIWPEVFALTGDAGARSLFAEHPGWLLTIPLPGKPPADVDTPEDHRRVSRAYGPSA
jgi:molybdenum cofactor cytidylyltransferase